MSKARGLSLLAMSVLAAAVAWVLAGRQETASPASIRIVKEGTAQAVADPPATALPPPGQVPAKVAIPASPANELSSNARVKSSALTAEYFALSNAKNFVDKYGSGKISAEAAVLMKQALGNCINYNSATLERFEKRYADAVGKIELAAEKLAATRRVRDACADFFPLSQEEMLGKLNKLSPFVTEGNDPVALAKQLATPNPQQSRENNLAAFEQIVRSKDALAYSELWGYFNGARTSEVWEMGGNPGDIIDPRLLGMAFASARCYFDGDCARSQLTIDAQCIMAGDLSQACQPSNLLDFMQQTRMSPAENRRFLAILEWLRPGIENNEWPPELFKPRPIRIAVSR